VELNEVGLENIDWVESSGQNRDSNSVTYSEYRDKLGILQLLKGSLLLRYSHAKMSYKESTCKM
jgi:hypothetical protein